VLQCATIVERWAAMQRVPQSVLGKFENGELKVSLVVGNQRFLVPVLLEEPQPRKYRKVTMQAGLGRMVVQGSPFYLHGPLEICFFADIVLDTGLPVYPHEPIIIQAQNRAELCYVHYGNHSRQHDRVYDSDTAAIRFFQYIQTLRFVPASEV